MYIIKIGLLEESCSDVDSAMHKCFMLFPDASFSSWNETKSETWLDIVDDGQIVGKIFELE